MSEAVDVREATERDLPVAIDMLSEAGLPTDDLSSQHLALVAESEAGIRGIIGLEPCGDAGLLRSLVVAPDARGEGVGCLLVASLELLARERGMQELWLLTIDADAFFSTLNFRVRARDAAPRAVRASEEFSALCPDDAVLMSKTL